ncbi:ribonuclease J [Candidatus Dojkabacteria bacterium]|nr:ribonuclease J [Candidatus Dojkabacteria bacterium]
MEKENLDKIIKQVADINVPVQPERRNPKDPGYKKGNLYDGPVYHGRKKFSVNKDIYKGRSRAARSSISGSPKSQRNALRVIPISGLDEVGRNCTVIQYGDDIAIIDLGMGFGDDKSYGVDAKLPNVEYLVENRRKIRGILVTHGHMDHIGALPYYIASLGYPTIYAPPFTIEMIKSTIFDDRVEGVEKGKVKLVTVSPRQIVTLGQIKAQFVRVTHSIPDSSTIVMHTPAGAVFFSGDYKFDDTPLNEPTTDYSLIKAVGDKHPILALLDSTNSYIEGRSKSEKDIYKILESSVKEAKGRVIVATFSSMINRVYSLIDIAHKLKKKVILLGGSIRKTYDIAVKTGYIQAHKDVVIDPRQERKYKDSELLFLVTGTQGEEMSVLSRLSRSDSKWIKIKPGDTVIMSSSVIPGNAIAIQHVIDGLIKLGADVAHQAILDVHVSGHAYQDDMKRMTELVRARNVLPVHGHLSFRVQHGKLLKKWGYKDENILIADDGTVWEYTGRNWVAVEQLKVSPVLVDGSMVMKKNDQVMHERVNMSESGVVLVKVSSSREIKFASKGIAPESYMNNVFKELESLVREELNSKNSAKEAAIVAVVKKHIEFKLGKIPEVFVAVSDQ